MADVFTKKKRSEIMSRIRAKDTKPEIDFLKKLSAEFYPKGIRYRKHYAKLEGKPDAVFVKQKIAVFLDSDFWHGRNFKKWENRLPKRYWREKIARNIKRDREVNARLKKSGWIALRFWERDLKRSPEKAVSEIKKRLKIAR